MKRSKSVRDFDFYIDEYMYNCQSRKLRKKTLQAYEQTLRLFERWCMDEMGITSPEEVREATFRRYICDMQERGKYTFFSVEESAIGYEKEFLTIGVAGNSFFIIVYSVGSGGIPWG